MKLTTNTNGYLNEVDNFVKVCVETYQNYLEDLFSKKVIDDLSYNEMAFIRLVSSSSILSMHKSGKSNLEILNTPVMKPAIAASKPITTNDVAKYLAGLQGEDLLKTLASLGLSKVVKK